MIRQRWILVLLLLTATTATGQSRDEFYIKQALERYFALPKDALSLSVSGAMESVCRTNACVYQNPAGLAFLPQFEASLTLGSQTTRGDEFIEDTSIEQAEDRGYIAASLPLGPVKEGLPAYGAIAGGFSRYQGKTDDSINTTPDGHRRTIGYGVAVHESLALGYSFTFYDDELESDLSNYHSHARVLHIFGAQSPLSSSLTLGAVFQLGVGQSDSEDIVFRSDGLSHLRHYLGSVGLSQEWGINKGFISIDYLHVNSDGNLNEVSAPVVIGGSEEGDIFTVRAGVESLVTEHLILRGGVRTTHGDYEFDRPDLKPLSGNLAVFGVSAGFGLTFPYTEESALKWILSYGTEYTSIGKGSWEQLVTLTVLQNPTR